MNWLKHLLVSKQTARFTVSARDIVISMYYAVGTSVVTAVLPNLQNMTMPTITQIKLAVGAGLVAGFQHVIRKFLTDEKGHLLISVEETK